MGGLRVLLPSRQGRADKAVSGAFDVGRERNGGVVRDQSERHRQQQDAREFYGVKLMQPS
jgi:hypothetical protein